MLVERPEYAAGNREFQDNDSLILGLLQRFFVGDVLQGPLSVLLSDLPCLDDNNYFGISQLLTH